MGQMEIEGFVRKCVGGFYTVETDLGLYTCTARGKFRKEKISPCAGDRVVVLVEENGAGALAKILPRRNHLIRPSIANLDQLFIVASVQEPGANTFLIDKTIAAAELKGICPVVVLTKADLGGVEPLEEAYHMAGIDCCVASSKTGVGVERVRVLLQGKVSAFIGNSGVGKSTLLNAVFPGLKLTTGEISQKLGRGRHTTRQVEFYKLESGYVADTPGFSTFDLERYQLTDKERLVLGFREIAAFAQDCQFTSCSHTCEKGCAVLQALQQGKIARSRFESYVEMYQEIKGVKQWELKSKRV